MQEQLEIVICDCIRDKDLIFQVQIDRSPVGSKLHLDSGIEAQDVTTTICL